MKNAQERLRGRLDLVLSILISTQVVYHVGERVRWARSFGRISDLLNPVWTRVHQISHLNDAAMGGGIHSEWRIYAAFTRVFVNSS